MPDGKGGLIYWFPADCGKCLKCLVKRKAQWGYRLTEENRVSFSSYFVTLTYDDKNVPHGDGTLSINKNDHTEFITNLKELESPKALEVRKAISIEEHERKERKIEEVGKLKYYGVYEYGDQLGRPHAHYIIFNVRDSNNIATAWAKGNIDVDPDVNVNNIDYVLKYMIKDHSNVDYEHKQKEVSFMSKGIGLCAADHNFQRSIKRVDQNQVINQRGRKIPIPRYYRKKFLSDEARLAKNQYIAAELIRQRISEQASDLVYGINREVEDLKSKKVRLHMLKTRQKRNVE